MDVDRNMRCYAMHVLLLLLLLLLVVVVPATAATAGDVVASDIAGAGPAADSS